MKDGGPAFPTHKQHWVSADGLSGGAISGSTGLSLRDYFAAAALTGLLANQNRSAVVENFATGAYIYADAMLATRSRD